MGEPLFQAKGDLVVSGLHPASGNSQIPLWEKGSNVVFKDGSVKPGPFQSLLFTKLSGLLGNGIRSIDNNGSPALVWGTRKHLYRGVDVPTSVNATRASTLLLDLDNDSGNWTPTGCTVSNEGTIKIPGGVGGSLKYTGDGAASQMYAYRDLASPTDFSGKTLTFWLYIDPTPKNKLAGAGDAIRIRLSSDLGAGTNYVEYHLSAFLVETASTWYQISLDLGAEDPDASSGAAVMTSIRSIALILNASIAFAVSDFAYWDDIEFSGEYTGTDLDRWSIVQFGQSVLASNGVDEVQYLADITSGLFVNLSTAGGDLPASFRCKILHKLGPYIIAFNTDNDDTEARWCTEDNVLVWSPIASNSARDINLRDMNSSIKCVVEFGNSLLVMGTSRAHIFQFIGAPLFFGAQKLMDGVGAVGKNAMTEGGRLIYGFSPHGIYLTDGSVKQYIDEPDIHSFVYDGDNRYDDSRAELVCVWEDTNDDEIYFSYPTIDGSGFTVSFNPKLQVWSMHNYWRTAASQGEHWRAAVMMGENGDIWLQRVGGAGSGFDVNPLGLSDTLSIPTGYGYPGYGELPYGGNAEYD